MIEQFPSHLISCRKMIAIAKSLAEEIREDSCGRKGLGETSKCAAQEGSPAPRGKRSVFLKRAA
ncbi:hypothetical protein CWR45_18150 [Oceanobacillus chungangensis]|uniref:Uncharacterized protein n=1 Tax=Oceanobacillus chungangensis TaxID=1229152 RepID=A0A3D8PKI0_9BACI|nr:hypothetical protein CWR45_18150 [Oceanobacillus chungangensis]